MLGLEVCFLRMYHLMLGLSCDGSKSENFDLDAFILNFAFLQEKQRSKVKEKFDKCNKEKLLEFCDVLDIPTSKTTRRKVR